MSKLSVVSFLSMLCLLVWPSFALLWLLCECSLNSSCATRVCKHSSMWACSHYWGIVILPFHSCSFHWTWKCMYFYSYISEKQEGGFINVIVHHIGCYSWHFTGFPGGSDGTESTCNAGDPSLIPGLGRSPVEKNSCPPRIPSQGLCGWRLPVASTRLLCWGGSRRQGVWKSCGLPVTCREAVCFTCF